MLSSWRNPLVAVGLVLFTYALIQCYSLYEDHSKYVQGLENDNIQLGEENDVLTESVGDLKVATQQQQEQVESLLREIKFWEDVIITQSTIKGTQSGVGMINAGNSTIRGGTYRLVTTLNDHSVFNITGSVLSGDTDTGLNDHSSLTVADSAHSGARYGLYTLLAKNTMLTGYSAAGVDQSTINILNDTDITSNQYGVQVSNAKNSAINIVYSSLTGVDVGLIVDNMTDSTVNINYSTLTWMRYFIFYGLDSTIFAPHSQSSNFYFNGRSMLVDISHSELGLLEANGDNEREAHNNQINVESSKLTNAFRAFRYNNDGENIVTLTRSEIIICDKSDSFYRSALDIQDSHNNTINMGNTITWIAKGTFNTGNLNITDSTVDIWGATVGADNRYSANTDVLVNSNSQLNITTDASDMNLMIESKGMDCGVNCEETINVRSGDIGSLVEYDVISTEQPNNAVLSSLAAPLASWNSQGNIIYDRLNSHLEQGDSNVWSTHYSSGWISEAGFSSTFNLKINGMAAGVDKTLSLYNGLATLGAAVIHDNSHLSSFDAKGSGSSMDSTAIQAYGCLTMGNGLFFKGTTSAGRTSSNLRANSSDGSVFHGDYKQTLFGLTGQTGYRYQMTKKVYVVSYAQMNGYTASGANFALDNGILVNSDRYWSAQGELGVEIGVKTAVGDITVTPHMLAATCHEFVKSNDVNLNGAVFNNAVDGSGYKVGAGVEAQMTNNLSGTVNVNYSHNRDVEQRFGVTAGMSYSF